MARFVLAMDKMEEEFGVKFFFVQGVHEVRVHFKNL